MSKKRLLASLFIILALFCSSACSYTVDSDYNDEQDKYYESAESEEDSSEEHVHEFSPATCYAPKTCYCGVTEGEPLEHNYVDGYCIACGVKDPDYVDLNNVGFTDNYGMNTWLKVVEYKLGEENKVKALTSKIRFYREDGSYFVDRGYKVDFFSDNFSNRYYISTSLDESTLTNNSTLSPDLFPLSAAITLDSSSNDVVQSNSQELKWTIMERVVRGQDKLIIKTLIEAKGHRGGSSNWFVPTDLLDFSTIKVDEENERYVWINFKEN